MLLWRRVHAGGISLSTWWLHACRAGISCPWIASLSPGASLSLWKAFALNGLDMPPACICLTQGNSFLRINLTQKNASAIGGILSPAGLPTSTQSLSTEHSTHKKLRRKNNLSFSREERRVRQEIYNIWREKENQPEENQRPEKHLILLKEIWFSLKTWEINIFTNSILAFETKPNLQSSGWDVNILSYFCFDSSSKLTTVSFIVT